MIDKTILTVEGHDELIKEIQNRKVNIRKQIADDIEKARQQGDLSENASYKASMEEKEFNETKIENLERMLANSVVQTKSKSKAGLVQLGSVIDVKDLNSNTNRTYKIVGENESNPAEGKISVKSPLGSLLIGNPKDAVLELITPVGKSKLQILSVK